MFSFWLIHFTVFLPLYLCDSFINWSKTVVQYVGPDFNPLVTVDVCNVHVEVVDSFLYLCSLVHYTGCSEPEIWRHIEIARSGMSELTRNIWRYGITLNTKLCLHMVYVLPILLYGCETWSLCDSFDRWCRRRILRLSYLQRVTNEEVTRRTATILHPTQVIRNAGLYYFGHVARSGSVEDHCHAISAALNIRPSLEWKRLPGRPRAVWLMTVEKDLAALLPGFHMPGRVLRTSSPGAESWTRPTLCQDARHWRRRR